MSLRYKRYVNDHIRKGRLHEKIAYCNSCYSNYQHYYGFCGYKEADSTIHLLGKMEANLWESAAAVYFHIADHTRGSQKIALNDYQDDIDTMENLNLSDQDRVTIAKIKNSWLSIKAMSRELIKIDVVQEKAVPIEDSKLRRYWLAVESLDHLIDEEIRALAGKH